MGGVSAQLFCSPGINSAVIAHIPFLSKGKNILFYALFYSKPTVIARRVNAHDRNRNFRLPLSPDILDHILIPSVEGTGAPKRALKRTETHPHLLLHR